MTAPSNVNRHAARVAAVLLVIGAYGMTRLPTLPASERAAIAERFGFTAHPLPSLGDASRRIRQVHPSLARYAGWVSSVGAAVAITDLDGDGLSNDIIHVDPRSDLVIVSPARGTRGRYHPFALKTHASGHDPKTLAPMGCVPGDFNEDGRMDVVVYYWGRTPVIFLGRPSAPESMSASWFVARAVVPGPGAGERWYTNAATSADVDGDGHLDLIFGNYFQDGARILDPAAGGTEQMQDSMSRAFNGGRDRLLLWADRDPARDAIEPDVHFREVPDAFPDPMGRTWTLAVGAADLDGDLLPELYFANDFGPDYLLHNRSRRGEPHLVPLAGRKTLGVPNSKVLGRDSFKGMGIDFGDLDGDGHLDMFVSNIADEYALEESHFVWMCTGDTAVMADGVAPYVDRSEPLGLSRSGWGWETRLADFDNDGILEALQATGFLKGSIDRWPELHELAMGNDELLRVAGVWPELVAGDDLSGHQHNPFYVRAASGRYFDLASDLRLDRPFVTRGIATADVDGDGDLDFVVANQWEESYYYRNDLGEGRARDNAFLVLNLRLTDPDRPAVGAVVTVDLGRGRRLAGHVDGGNGHSGVRSHQVHFGLGPIARGLVLPVEIRWRGSDGSPRRTTRELTAGTHTVRLESEPAP